MSSPNQIQILVGIACYQEIAVQTVTSLLSFYRTSKYPVQIRFKPYTYIHVARNSMLLDAINTGATHLMFIDSDMVFDPDAVAHLVEQDKDFIGGLYHKRISPHVPVLYRKVGQTLQNIIVPPHDGKEIFEVDAIGTGFMLLKMEAMKKMNPPFFYYAMPSEFGLKDSQVFDLGEDISFCLKARSEGFKIYCDPTFKLGHVGLEIF